MACLDMYNNSSSNHHHDQYCPPPMSPRISFSNDFVESSSSQQLSDIRRSSKEKVSSSGSSDFEFSVTNYSMMSADELFFKGRLLPFKDTGKNNQKTTTTLREELLAGDDEDDNNYGVSFKPPKSGSTRWKGFLGLKKSHIGSKKVERGDGRSMIVDNKRNEDSIHISNTSQEMLNDGGSNGRDDVEMGI